MCDERGLVAGGGFEHEVGAGPSLRGLPEQEAVPFRRVGESPWLVPCGVEDLEVFADISADVGSVGWFHLYFILGLRALGLRQLSELRMRWVRARAPVRI